MYPCQLISLQREIHTYATNYFWSQNVHRTPVSTHDQILWAMIFDHHQKFRAFPWCNLSKTCRPDATLAERWSVEVWLLLVYATGQINLTFRFFQLFGDWHRSFKIPVDTSIDKISTQALYDTFHKIKISLLHSVPDILGPGSMCHLSRLFCFWAHRCFS